MTQKNIIITGEAGFIGSNLVRRLNEEGFSALILVDKFDIPAKEANLEGVKCTAKIERDVFAAWLKENAGEVEFIFHLGARTDTTEFDFKVLDELNLNYSKALWEICTEKQLPIVYASSDATYGMGEQGVDDKGPTRVSWMVRFPPF